MTRPESTHGCKAKLANGQWWHFCGETDMGQSAPALCVDCGGEFIKEGAITCPQPMVSAPKNGTRILLFHNTRGLSFRGQRYVVTGDKWEECRWISDKDKTGSEPHWEPWCGNYETRSTLHIREKDAKLWLPIP